MQPNAIGPYSIVEQIGAGGMGAVYAVEREGRRYALKLAHEQLASVPEATARFLREAKVGLALDHPNVVRTLDVGDHEGLPYLVMEFVQGRNLREHLAALGTIPEALLREVARQIAAGLAAVHAIDVVHRDVKPENILITDTHEVRLMDLGVASLLEATTALTREGGFAGSLLYAAPEQFRSDPVSAATDLYALGVVLYELASGENPFHGSEPASVIQRHLTHVPPTLAAQKVVSPFFSAIIDALLAKDPTARIGSTVELVEILEQGEDSAWWAAREQPEERPRIGVAHDTALYGRDAEMERLLAAWRDAREGRGGAILIQGESGIGKSRLLDELLEQASSDEAHLLYGAFRKRGGVRALGDALGSRLKPTPDLRGAFAARVRGELPPEGAPTLRGDAFAMMAGRAACELAETKPVLWMLDDAQFGDEDAHAALTEIARSATDRPILLVLASTEPLDLDFETLTLRRLGARDVIDLLTDSLRSAPLAERLGGRIAAKSDGVPLFILELLRGLEESDFLSRDDEGVAVQTRRITEIEVPSTLRGLIDQRLAELDDDDRDLLEVAALQGPRFDPGLCAAVLDRKRVHVLRRLAALERRTRMVRADGDRYRFDQRQVQETLEVELEPGLAREYHELLREACADRGGESGEDALFVTHHGLRGTAPEEGRRRLDAALSYLQESFRGEELIHLGDTALGVPGLLTGDERAGLLLKMDDQFAMRGAPEARQAALTEALEVAETPRMRMRVRGALGNHALDTGDPDASLAHFEEMQRIAQESGDTGAEIRALGGIGIVLDRTDRTPQAITYLEAQVALAEAQGDDVGQMLGNANLGLALSRVNRDPDALDHTKRALDLARKLGRRDAESALLGNLAMLGNQIGDEELVEKHAAQCIEISREIGNRRSQLYALNHLTYLSFHAGRCAECLDRIAPYLELARDLSDPRMEASALDHRAPVRAMLGRVDGALDDHREAIRIFDRIQDSSSGAKNRIAMAELLQHMDRRDEAVEALQEALRIAQDLELAVIEADVYLVRASWGEDPAANLKAAKAVIPENSIHRALRLKVTEAALGNGDREAAAQAIREQRPRPPRFRELQYWLLLGESEEARRAAQHIVDHAPPEDREAMVETSPLIRAALAT